MELNDIYNQFSGFWNRILPVLVFHLIGIFLLQRIGKINFNIRSGIEDYIKTDSYLKNKELLEEFKLWSKIPFLILISLIIYLVVFDDIARNVRRIVPNPIDLSWSSQDLFSKAYNRNLARVALYTDSTMNDVSYSEINNINIYINQQTQILKSEYPDLYSSRVGWIEKKANKYNAYFHYGFFYLLLLPLIFTMHKGRRKIKAISFYLRFTILFFITLVLLIFFRVNWEDNKEKEIAARIGFIADVSEHSRFINPKSHQFQLDNLSDKISEHYKTRDYHVFWLKRLFNSKP
ncbi:hypothetical protein WIW50_11820 [Flavobacteriaceae bacterium 3-367]|uniref:hypothetical protein n=1 Tax=Eudoraea algarum TaxID=3417568 RepID=UPI00328D081C